MYKRTTNELRGYVHEVAHYLDEDVPRWPQVLVDAYGDDLSGLYINDMGRCILSALFGDYVVGINTVFKARDINIYRNRSEDVDDKPVRAHYNPVGTAVASYLVNREEEAILREAWLVEINDRLADDDTYFSADSFSSDVTDS